MTTRPHIPLDIRIKVAARQLRDFGMIVDRDIGEALDVYLDRQLALLALYLDSDNLLVPLELHHDPALCNRKFSERSGRYTPAANDPKFLVYLTKTEHDLRTRIRGEGAQLSDLALRRKNKRIAKRIQNGKRPKYGVRT